jgi:signal transduction histidine kinase
MTNALHAVGAVAYLALTAVAWIAIRRAREASNRAARERHALDIHDNVVQGLTEVSWALEAGANDVARAAAHATLADARELIGDVLEQHPGGHVFGPGSLRRSQASGRRP